MYIPEAQQTNVNTKCQHDKQETPRKNTRKPVTKPKSSKPANAKCDVDT